MSLHESISGLKASMREENIDPVRGLGDELFVFASTLMPFVNVDLIATNRNGEFLLSWRDDPHCGRGWHVPGGCIRLTETLETRLQKTARSELATEVAHEPAPFGVYEILTLQHRDGIEDQRERCHAITLAYLCRVPDDYAIPADRSIPGTPGCLKWFRTLPDDLLEVQHCYHEHWNEIKDIVWRNI